MTIFQSIILGIVQGLTEFLPVSSSAHLVLVPAWLGWQLDPGFVFIFDVLVQMGTLLAVIVYFWKDLGSIVVEVFRGIISRKPFEHPSARLGWLVVLGTIPAVIIALLLKDVVESAFSSPYASAWLLLITAKRSN
jgi:undecaprenyl-diphosphatase